MQVLWKTEATLLRGESEIYRMKNPNDSLKIITEKPEDGYVAYPIGLKGLIVGQGDTYDDVLADVTSAIKFHNETFGPEAFLKESPVLEAFVAEARLAA
jgi:predicted RNase H-like HicB family nuclease